MSVGGGGGVGERGGDVGERGEAWGRGGSNAREVLLFPVFINSALVG